MAHDSTKAALGTTTSSIREVQSQVGTTAAGIAVRRKSDGTLSTTKAHGQLWGVSLGKDQSDTNKVAVCVRGAGVPLILAASFTPTYGAIVYIDDATGKGTASATDATACNATYSKILSGGGIPEDGSAASPCALIDYVGGL
jgi:hypothetical protein